MTTTNNLIRNVKAGDILKPWIMLGPFNHDLSSQVVGLSYFENKHSTVGRAAMDEVVEEARKILALAPTEGQKTDLRGDVTRWNLVRGHEKYLSWGTYNIVNHLGAAFLSTIVSPSVIASETKQSPSADIEIASHSAKERGAGSALAMTTSMHQWRLLINNARALVSINGMVVFDSVHPMQVAPSMAQGGRAITHHGTLFEYRFAAELQAGENAVNVGLFRIGRMAQVGMRLEITDSDATVRAPITSAMSLETRALIEEEVNSLRLPRDIIYPEHHLTLLLGQAQFTEGVIASVAKQSPSHEGDCFGAKSAPRNDVEQNAPNSGIRLQLELMSHDGKHVRTVMPTAAGEVSLAAGAELADGAYHIRCTWLDKDGTPFTSTSFNNIHKVTPIAAPQGYDKIDERRRRVLEHFANHVETGIHRVWTQVARYALGQFDCIDEDAIRWTCEYVAARSDCADFVIQGLLRLMCWEREQRHLSSDINSLMKDTILGFKYWIDEPGDTVMFMGSENHRLLFHVAEWLAGWLFPLDEFSNSHQNGLFHYQKAYVYITEWLRQRGRFGFDEWHSNSYFPVCIAPLLNVYDFAAHEGQYKLRQMTSAVLDEMFFTLAADSYEGIWGTTHGRSYGVYIKHPDLEGTAALCWLLFGNGTLTGGTADLGILSMSVMASVCAASAGSSAYKPPKIIYDMATDRTSVVAAKERHGILRTSVGTGHANFLVHRTPDYLLSGLQDHHKGEFESATHTAQITLGNKANIFWSCPHTTDEGMGLRPDYWSGSSVMPRVIQHQHVMSLTFRLNELTWMSHAWFPQVLFDEVRFAGNWVFVRVKRGYVGIYSQNGMQVAADGEYAGRELQCWAQENTWLVECGREGDNGYGWQSFDGFVAALSAARITATTDGVITYESPSVGSFVTGWDVTPTVNGVPIPLSRYPLVDSAWGHADFGSGEMVLRYGDAVYELWFNQ